MLAERESIREQLAEVRAQVSALTGQRDAAVAERDALRSQVASQLTIIDTFTRQGNGEMGTDKLAE